MQFITPNGSADFTFGYGSSASLTYLLTVKGSGNVGIGTTAPQSLLHAYGGEVQVGSSSASCCFGERGRDTVLQRHTLLLRQPQHLGKRRFKRRSRHRRLLHRDRHGDSDLRRRHVRRQRDARRGAGGLRFDLGHDSRKPHQHPRARSPRQLDKSLHARQCGDRDGVSHQHLI